MNKELSDELKEISSGLLSKPENNVPEGYFENLPSQLLERWNNEEVKASPVIFRLRKMIAAAAVVAGISIAVALSTTTGVNNPFRNEITASDAYAYITTHMDEFESLMEEPIELVEQGGFQLLESEAVEEYLLQEMDGSDLELIF